MINRTPTNRTDKDGKPINMQELFKRQNSTGLDQQNSTVKYDYQKELQTVGMRIRQRIDQGYQIPPTGQPKMPSMNTSHSADKSPSLNPNHNIRDYASIIVPQFRSGSDLTPLFEETENIQSNNCNINNSNSDRNNNSQINTTNFNQDEEDDDDLRRKRRVQ